MIKQLKHVAALLVLVTPVAQAAECEANFKTSGNVLIGKIFKTSAKLPGMGADAAFQRTYLEIAKQGFILQQSDSAARVVSARNNGSTADRPQTLNAMLEPGAQGAHIALTFSIPAGTLATDTTIRTEFCKLINSVMEPGPAAASTAKPAPSDAPVPRATTVLADERNRLCIANACLGMRLEQAASLDLRAARAGAQTQRHFTPTTRRAGLYGVNKKGELISINQTTIDRNWINAYRQHIALLCEAPLALHASLSASDGRLVDLNFVLRSRQGRVDYEVVSIQRHLSDSASSETEWRKLQDELRRRYGQAFVEPNDIQRSESAGKLDHAVVQLAPRSIQLHAARATEALPNLLEQAGCLSRPQID